jgi:hypothetical protein
MVRKILACSLLLLLAGCTLNNSFAGRVTAGYAGLAATNDTALVLVNAGVISKPDGASVLKKTRQARETLDIAYSVRDLSTLEAALELLREAQADLCKGHETNPNCILLTQQRAVQ